MIDNVSEIETEEHLVDRDAHLFNVSKNISESPLYISEEVIENSDKVVNTSDIQYDITGKVMKGSDCSFDEGCNIPQLDGNAADWYHCVCGARLVQNLCY